MGRPPRSLRDDASGSMSPTSEIEPPPLDRPALFDTGVWTWARDRRFPQLASWFNTEVAAGRVLVCDVVVLELARLAPNEARAREITARLDAFASIPMETKLWTRARELQLLLTPTGDHRRIPPVDLLIGAAAEAADVTLVHYDRDYERLANVSHLEHRWLLPDGTLA